MKTIFEDILNVRKGIICHQINPYVMGAGLARAIRAMYPVHYEDFERWKKDRQRIDLGDVLFTQINEDLIIAGLIAQAEYGYDRCYTDYRAFTSCLLVVYNFSNDRNIEHVYLPWKIGCGLAGGDWGRIESLIAQFLPDAILCKLGG